MGEMTPESLAQLFHETYERLAPEFGYRIREASAKPWAQVPENNRALMTAVCREILPAVQQGQRICGARSGVDLVCLRPAGHAADGSWHQGLGSSWSSRPEV